MSEHLCSDCKRAGADNERCNAWWRGIDGDQFFRCIRDAGHEFSHASKNDRQLWYDDASGAKPHVPAEPVWGPGVAQGLIDAGMLKLTQERNAAIRERDASYETATSDMLAMMNKHKEMQVDALRQVEQLRAALKEVAGTGNAFVELGRTLERREASLLVSSTFLPLEQIENLHRRVAHLLEVNGVAK